MTETTKRTTKVWAHRGASAYAPENTLEAFLLAAEQGADGVELDVQLTKDGEMVVVHDEEIDRVSDGSGFVKDYTLAELKTLNFNKTHPEYQDVKIPTLREVYEALKLAIRQGADGIELDVHTSADGELIVMHDENVDRVTDGTGLIKDMTLAQLKELKVSTPAEPSGIYHIPTLAEVLELMK